MTLIRVLTVIGLIGAWSIVACSIPYIVQKFYRCGPVKFDKKIKIFQTRWKPFILLPKVVIWWSTGYDISRVDLKRSWFDRSPVLWFPKKWKFLHVRTCQIRWKIGKRQTFQKPWISHPRVVNNILISSWHSLGGLVLDISHALL